MRIEIVPEKIQKKAPSGTWLEFWETSAKKKASKCSVIGCASPADTGGQVIKPSMGPTATFVVPLCAEHAKKAGDQDVAESTYFAMIPAGKK